jgi:mannonate dehydratase
MRAFDKVGSSGVMAPDHVPLIEGKTDWEFESMIGRSYTVGYLKMTNKSLK